MGNTDIFEFYETSSKRQCPDCTLYWEIGIVYCEYGKCMQPTEKNRQFNKDRFDMLSLPGYVRKKNQSRGPIIASNNVSEGTRYVEKSQTSKEWSLPNILERWYKDAKYRADLPEHGWTEEQIRQYGALALEDQSYEATPGEKRRWEKNGRIVLNKEGKQGSMKQRPDFREAKQVHRQLYKEHAESTGEGIDPIHPAHQARSV